MERLQRKQVVGGFASDHMSYCTEYLMHKKHHATSPLIFVGSLRPPITPILEYEPPTEPRPEYGIDPTRIRVM